MNVLIKVVAILFAARHSGEPGGWTPSWEDLRDAYSYDMAQSFDVQIRQEPMDGGVRLHLEFASPSGGMVAGIFERPKAPGRYPVALLMHGLTGNKEQAIGSFERFFIAHKVAVLALDAPHHGERRTAEDHDDWMKLFEAKTRLDNPDLAIQVWQASDDRDVARVFASTIHDGVLDYRRALDFLASRSDCDPSKVAAVGTSMGAIMCAILAGVDTRVDCASMVVAGDPFYDLVSAQGPSARELAIVAPSLFVSHVSPRPVLFLNGYKDRTIPREAAERLFNAAGQPKLIDWYPYGHLLPSDAYHRAAQWTLRWIGRGSGTPHS